MMRQLKQIQSFPVVFDLAKTQFLFQLNKETSVKMDFSPKCNFEFMHELIGNVIIQ